ncbi:hypothetical protein GCM10018987_00120 [Streptomyces cremeus]
MPWEPLPDVREAMGQEVTWGDACGQERLRVHPTVSPFEDSEIDAPSTAPGRTKAPYLTQHQVWGSRSLTFLHTPDERSPT